MSGLYCVAKERMLKPAAGAGNTITLNGASIVAALIKTTYTFDVTAQTQSLSASLALASRVLNGAFTSVTNDEVLTGTTVSSSNGITHFDATDAIFESVSTGQVIHGILIYNRIGDDTDSIPIAFINISTTTSNGATINVNWDNGVNRIFALTG